jgi:multimeric flavodoxin WrbA
MKILLVNGSPRQHGNTDILLDKVAEGVRLAGREAETIRLADLTIHPCIGCGHCEAEGVCVIDDDMTPLYDKLARVDRVVIGTPVYFYGVTAQTKAFIDRCQALWCRKYLLGQIRLDRDRLRGYLVSVAATDGGRIFDGTRLTVRYLFDALDITYAGELLVRGVEGKGAVTRKPDRLAEAVALGEALCHPARPQTPPAD